MRFKSYLLAELPEKSFVADWINKSMYKKEVLLIIPAYNEEANIAFVVDEIAENYPEFDYVVIDDGSSDDTKRICKNRGYNIISLSVNLGLAGAFQTGMRYAYQKGYKYAVQFDGDGQHSAQYIQAMKVEADNGAEIVIASRFLKKKKPMSLRMIGSSLISLAVMITTGTRLTDPTSGMRMYSSRAIEEFALNINYGPEPDTVSYLIKQGIRVSEVQAQMKERQGGKSYLTFFNSIKYMIRMLVSIIFIQNFRKRDLKYSKK